MENQVPEIKQWNLYGSLIRLQADGSYSWTLYTKKTSGVETGWGHCWIAGDVLVIGILSIVDKLRTDRGDPDDPVKFVPTLPKWDRTKYFVSEDSGGIRSMDCVTGENVTDPAITDAIMHEIGIS